MRVAFLVQYFRHPANIEAIQSRMSGGALRDAHVIWHNDSQSDRDIFGRAVSPPSLVVESPNVHEIRGYNTMAELTDAEYLVFWQDDDIPDRQLRWCAQAIEAFELEPELGLIGSHRAVTRPVNDAGSMIIGGDTNPIAFRHPTLGYRFEYVAFAWGLPLMVRRKDFLHLGKFDTRYSKPGEPGIGFEDEYCTRVWLAGQRVALMDGGPIRRGVGGQGTLSTPAKAALRERKKVEFRQAYHSLYAEHYTLMAHRIDQANEALKPRSALRHCDNWRHAMMWFGRRIVPGSARRLIWNAVGRRLSREVFPPEAEPWLEMKQDGHARPVGVGAVRSDLS